MSMGWTISLAVAGCLAAGAAGAAPRDYELPDAYSDLRPAKGEAAGLAATQGHCLTCHSTDYIAMQPPGKEKAFWDAEVTKMIKVYRAPIDEADARSIAAYLAEAY